MFADTRAAVAAPGKPDTLAESADQLHPPPAGYRRDGRSDSPGNRGCVEGSAGGRVPGVRYTLLS